MFPSRRSLSSCLNKHSSTIVCFVSFCESESGVRVSRSEIRVESLASVWFMGLIALERSVLKGGDMFKIASQGVESRKLGLRMRNESMTYDSLMLTSLVH